MRHRKELTKQEKVDIRAARMFVPVVVLLTLCNVEPIAMNILIRLTDVFYRELIMGWFLSIALNSTANLLIYYVKGSSSFRSKIRGNLPRWMRTCFDKLPSRKFSDVSASSEEIEMTPVSQNQKEEAIV